MSLNNENPASTSIKEEPTKDNHCGKHMESFVESSLHGTISPSSVSSLFPESPPSLANRLLESYSDLLQATQNEDESSCAWVDVESYLSRLLSSMPHALGLFRSVYRIGVQLENVLKALAHIVMNDEYMKHSHETLAVYFCLPGTSDLIRLACVRLVVVLKSPLEAGWQVEESFVRDSLDFIMKNNDWEFINHSEMLFLRTMKALVHVVRHLEGILGLDESDYSGEEPLSTVPQKHRFNSELMANLSSFSADIEQLFAMKLQECKPSATVSLRDTFIAKKRSRQSLRELEQRFTSQANDHRPNAPANTESEISLTQMEATVQNSSNSVGSHDMLTLHSSPQSFRKRIAGVLSMVIPTRVAQLAEPAMLTDANYDRGQHSGIWDMQLSKMISLDNGSSMKD